MSALNPFYYEIGKEAEYLKFFFDSFAQDLYKKFNSNKIDEEVYYHHLIILILHTYYGGLASYNVKYFTNVALSAKHLFECFLICKEITLDKSSAKRWFNFGKYQRLKFIIDNHKFYNQKEIEDAALEIKSEYEEILSNKKGYKDCWNGDGLKIAERAKKFDLEDQYKIIYKESCFISHPSSSFEFYMRQGLDGLLYQLIIRLYICILYFTQSIYEINKIYPGIFQENELTTILKKIGKIISEMEQNFKDRKSVV